MKMTLEELIKEMEEINELFPNDTKVRAYLKIDLYKDIEDKIFFEALRETNVEKQEWRIISCTRHEEINSTKEENEESYNAARKFLEKYKENLRKKYS